MFFKGRLLSQALFHSDREIMNTLPSAGGNSNAYNFLSFIQSGVDPRTGSYSCRIALSELTSNSLSGPELPLALSFDPLIGANLGFGHGWSLGVSGYSESSRKLQLSTGASHEALLSPEAFVLLGNKINDVRTSRSGSELHIEHKTGTLEVLKKVTARSSDWLISALYSAQGQGLFFTYGLKGATRYLSEVRDSSRLLVKVTFAGTTPTIVLWPDCPEKKLAFTLILQNGRLGVISVNPGTPDQLEWRFQYTQLNNLTLISRLQQPTGGLETLQYRSSELRLPSSAPISALPAVFSHSVFPGANQPSIRREYSYSANNYLGFGSNAAWRASGDNLYNLPGSYEYSCTETLVEGSGSQSRVIRSVKRTYNRFHLQVREFTQQGTKVVDKRIEYHGSAGLAFEKQSPKFQLPKRETTTCYDTQNPVVTRTEETITEFDDFGNMLRKVLPSGIIELYEFYPAGGVDGCPADSFGRPRWLRSKTVVPAASSVQTSALSTHFRYIQMPSIHAARPAWIAVARESLYERDGVQPFKVIDTAYEVDKSSPFFGKVIRRTETMASFSTTLGYTYRLSGDLLQTDITLSGDDRISSTRTMWEHVLTGQEVRSIGQTGVVIEMSYDRLGRLITEVLQPGHADEATKTFEYRLPETTGAPLYVVVTDASGAKTRTRLDGLNRELSIEVQDMESPGNPMRLTYSASYDALGQLVREVDTDWIQGKPVSVSTTHEYDHWGNRTYSETSSGIKRHDRLDPITLTRTQWQEGAGRTVIVKNLFDQPLTVQRIDRRGVSHGATQYVYDGLGRCVEQISPAGHRTHFTYDFADRLLSTQLPDGTVVEKDYVRHSTEDLATHIRVNGYLAGERTFDSLLRVTKQSIGGRTELFSFEGAQDRPATRTTPAGTVLQFAYEPSLDNQLKERRVKTNHNLSARFRYDAIHGGLIQASDPGSQQERHYSRNGKLRREASSEGAERFEARHDSTLNGLPLSYTAASGQTQTITYDAFCRASILDQGTLRATFTYNDLGQPARIDTVDLQTGQGVETTLEYDDFGRETRRVIAAQRGSTLELLQQFDDSDKLIRRTLRRGSEVLRDEQFRYDPRGRLERYSCSGPQAPVDAKGQPIVSQTYSFDALDNIRELVTVFVGGQDVATYHYENPDRTQLTQVSHSHADYKVFDASFQYSSDGHQLNDEQGRGLVYDELGRLVSVIQSPVSRTPALVGYRYDPLDRLLGKDIAGQAPSTHFYRDDRLAARRQGEEYESFIQHDGHLLAQACRKGARTEHSLLATDQRRSVLEAVHPAGQQQSLAYTPYGSRAGGAGLNSLLGFNGELPDPVTGCYLLGNGYRAYNPVLMRFHSPDNLSPFGAGGINAYAYCVGDPINLSDPTGHFSWRAIAGIVLAVASIALTAVTLGTTAPLTGPTLVGSLSLSTSAAIVNVAANTVGIAATIAQEVAPRSEAGAILGYVSLGLGILGAGLGKAAARTAGEAATTLTRQGAIKVSNGQALQSFAGAAKLGAGARNTVLIEERLRLAGEILNGVEWLEWSAEKIEDYVIPYLFAPRKKPDQPPEAQSSTLEQVLRAGSSYVAKKVAVEAVSQFVAPDRKRLQQIRRLF